MNKQKLIAIVSGLSLALLSTAALAATSDNTQFVSGYDYDGDAEKAKVIYSVSGIDQEDDATATLDCGVTSGDYVYVVDGTDPEATEVDVTELYESNDGAKGDPVVFNSENPADTDDYAYDSPEAEASDCTLTAVTIEPKGDGDINHGTVVSTMTKQFGPGMGCLTSQVAKTDWGKKSYEEDNGEGVVSLDTLSASCNKNKRNDDSTSASTTLDDDSTSGGNGQQKAAKQNGKATAPGQLKKNG